MIKKKKKGNFKESGMKPVASQYTKCLQQNRIRLLKAGYIFGLRLFKRQHEERKQSVIKCNNHNIKPN